MEELDKAIGGLITQLLIIRDERDKHKQSLQELLDEQQAYHNQASAAAAAAADDDDIEEVVGDNTAIATYDNGAAAAAITITTHHRDHAMQLHPDIYVSFLPYGSSVAALKRDLLDQHFCCQWLDSPRDGVDKDRDNRQHG